jgi:tetratricopeptide (TPR) repeat protein
LEALPHYAKAYHYRPENIEYAFGYALALQEQNDHAASELVYRQLLPRLRDLAAANPAAYLPDLANTLNNLGILYRATQRLADAEQAYTEARDIGRKLAAANPAAYLPDLATTLNNLRIFLSDSGRTGEAEQVGLDLQEVLGRLNEVKHARATTAQ